MPMTLSSFIVPRPPALPGVAMTLMWTTVSTSSIAMTFAITGLRMSARWKVTPVMSPRGRHHVDADHAVDVGMLGHGTGEPTGDVA